MNEARPLIHDMFGLDDRRHRPGGSRALPSRRQGQTAAKTRGIRACRPTGQRSGGRWPTRNRQPRSFRWRCRPNGRRILDLLELIPRAEESKTLELLRALSDLWAVHPGEKIVVFTTYLGSVDALKAAVDQKFPQAGVEVLKGGDHGAKLAAERRFKRPMAPEC